MRSMADDANKRINLTAPLLSVRRHGGNGAETTATGLLAPAYNYKVDDATSEPTGGHTTSAVPFGWEHRPGHPKSVRTRRLPPPPPPQALPLTTIVVDVDEPSHVTRNPTTAPSERSRTRSEARCSDALSRDDDVSCVTVNCSGTGLSEAATAGAGAVPCARGSVMLDRFLPAAHAVAAGSPQNTFRKAGLARPGAVVLGARLGTAGGGGESDRRSPAQRRVPPLQHIAAAYHLMPLSPRGKNGKDDDDANSDAHSTPGLAAKRCGLLLSTRCVKSALLLSCGGGRPFQSNGGGGSQREKKALLRPRSRSRNGQNQLQHTGDDHGMQSWEEVYIKSLLRSGRGGLMGMGPAAAVASELDRTVRELYKRRDGQAVRPKASHLGLLLVLDRSNEACGHVSPARRKLSRTGDTALLLKATTTTKSSPNDTEKRLAGGYGFPLLLEDKEAVAGREMALSPAHTLLSLPLPMSPTESWLSRALTSVSTRPPAATSFLGLHVQPKKHAATGTGPWCSIDSSRGRDVDVHHDRQRQIRVHDLQK